MKYHIRLLIDGLFAFIIYAVIVTVMIWGCTAIWQVLDKGTGNELKREAVEKGFAEYNCSTGKWQWKTKENSK
jgi:hypothetical protein